MDHATPNLPSRDFGATKKFYSTIGFDVDFENEQWMILRCNSIVLEFFPYPELVPTESSFSCCLRLLDVDAFVTQCRAAGIPERKVGFPRIHAPAIEGNLRIGYLLDTDGTLLRLVGRA